jgi:anion-transporting  ArsA/GET3 family ATPase
MYGGFVERAEAVMRLLADRRSTFVVVTTLESAALAEGEFFCDKIREFGLPLGALVLNRVLPDFLFDEGVANGVPRLQDEGLMEHLSAELGRFGHPLDNPARVRGVLATLAENFINFRTVASREAAEKRLSGPPSGLASSSVPSSRASPQPT